MDEDRPDEVVRSEPVFGHQAPDPAKGPVAAQPDPGILPDALEPGPRAGGYAVLVVVVLVVPGHGGRKPSMGLKRRQSLGHRWAANVPRPSASANPDRRRAREGRRWTLRRA